MRMTSHTRIALNSAIPALFLGVAFGLFFGSIASLVPHHRSSIPSLTQEELSYDYRVMKEITPLTMTLRVVENVSDFGCPSWSFACTIFNRDPCEIILPAHQKVWLWPKRERAEWIDSFMSRTLVHEMMHCYYGDWHKGASNATADP